MDFNVKQWITTECYRKDHPLFNMKINGKPLAQLFSQFTYDQTESQIDADRIRMEFVYKDEKNGLEMKMTALLFTKYDAIDLVLTITNHRTINSPVISEIQVFDSFLSPFLPNGADQIIHHARGSNAAKNDFEPQISVLKPKRKVKFHPHNGRSSNKFILPFFTIETKGIGSIFIAVGWSGQWTSTIRKEKTGDVRFTLGMERTQISLEGNETIRTPRILLVPWRGTRIIDGHNLFRRFLVQYYVPRIQNRLVQLPLAFYGRRGFKHSEEANFFTEANQIEFSNAIAQFKPEIHWIDAGWFEGGWPNGVGSWTLRKDGFPNGLKPVSDTDRKNGMKLLLWFELERVHVDSWIANKHPEFCLCTPKNKNMLFDLGNPAARKWLIDYIIDFIKINGIGLFRLDFNHDPLPFWKRADTKNRIGIHELRHIEGLYEFWDTLHQTFPEMITDNCASGGRRIDLESIARNVMLTRTDYSYYEPDGPQCHTHAINLFVPTSATFTNETVAYKVRSVMTNGMMLTWDPFKPGFDAEFGKKILAEFQEVRGLYIKDYYPLSLYSMENNVWCVFQFHDPQKHTGMVLAFRRQDSPQESYRVSLEGLDETREYQCTLSDEHLIITNLGNIGGRELHQGYNLTISHPMESLMFRYQ